MSFTPPSCGHPAVVISCPTGCHVPGYHLHWHCSRGCRAVDQGEATEAVSAPSPAAPPPQADPPAAPAPPAAPTCGPAREHGHCDAGFCHVAYEQEPLFIERSARRFG